MYWRGQNQNNASGHSPYRSPYSPQEFHDTSNRRFNSPRIQGHNNQRNTPGHSPYRSPYSSPHEFQQRLNSPPFRPNSPGDFSRSPNRLPWTSGGNRSGSQPGMFTSTPRGHRPWTGDRRSWSSNESHGNNRSSIYSSSDGNSPASFAHSPGRSLNSSWQGTPGRRIEDYVHPSMLEDPWAELEKQILAKKQLTEKQT